MAKMREVTITRECEHCEGNGDIETTLDIDGEFEKPEPDVGLTGGYVVNGAYLTGSDIPFELTDDEKKEISEDAEVEYTEEAEEAESEE